MSSFTSNATGTGRSGEMLHIAVGQTACEVAAHWCHLTGLAGATTTTTTPLLDGNNNNDHEDDKCCGALCNMNVTHTIHSTGATSYYVPRMLFVPMGNPSRTRMPPVAAAAAAAPNSPQQQQQQQTQEEQLSFPTWQGRVQPVYSWNGNHVDPLDNSTNSSFLSPALLTAGGGAFGGEQDQGQLLLTCNPYSPYAAAAPRRNAPVSSSYPNRNSSYDDDDEEGEQEEDEEQEAQWREQQQGRRLRERQDYHNTLQQQATQWQEHWNSTLSSLQDPSLSSSTRTTSDSTSILQQQQQQSLQDSQQQQLLLPSSSSNSAVVWDWNFRDHILRLAPYDEVRSMVPFPIPITKDTNSSSIVSDWDSYVTGSTLSGNGGSSCSSSSLFTDWYQTELWDDRIRLQLEDCDSCAGVLFFTSSSSSGSSASGDDFASGVTTALLQDFQQECPSAQRLVLAISHNQQQQEQDMDEGGNKQDEAETTTTRPTWRTDRVQRLRRHVNAGLQLADWNALAHVVVPLQLPALAAASSTLSSPVRRFHATALTAAALECVTTPYRLQSSSSTTRRPKALMGLNSYYYGSYSGNVPFGTAANVRFAEFVKTLVTPTAKHNVLELSLAFPNDILAGASSNSSRLSLYDRLKQGTSIERDDRMRQQGQRDVGLPQQVLPGSWLQNVTTTNDRGWFTSLLPDVAATRSSSHMDWYDRSLHSHFAMSTALRTSLVAGATSRNQQSTADRRRGTNDSAIHSYTLLQNHVSCLMQGMGIRFRPDQCMAVTIDQSLNQFTTASLTPAGSYWKTVLTAAASAGGTGTHQDISVLTSLGNTTRIYPYLHQTALHLKQALSVHAKRSRTTGARGYYNRDVLTGMLPDSDDCQEAADSCWTLRDLYHPPEGRGLPLDDDDMNGGNNEEDF